MLLSSYSFRAVQNTTLGRCFKDLSIESCFSREENIAYQTRIMKPPVVHHQPIPNPPIPSNKVRNKTPKTAADIIESLIGFFFLVSFVSYRSYRPFVPYTSTGACSLCNTNNV